MIEPQILCVTGWKFNGVIYEDEASAKKAAARQALENLIHSSLLPALDAICKNEYLRSDSGKLADYFETTFEEWIKILNKLY